MARSKLFLLPFYLIACTTHHSDTVEPPKADDYGPGRNYELELYGGVYVESFDSTVVDPERYNQNNKIYTVGTSYRYEYDYSDSSGLALLFDKTKTGWTFVPRSAARSTTVAEVIIRVEQGQKSSQIEQGRESGLARQTRVSYRYPPDKFTSSFSGVIENEMNVWIHPPRDYLFGILELNPFPFIQQPYRVGNSWQWDLTIPSYWGDERWKTWSGSITNRGTYRIAGRQEISTSFGMLTCYEVAATAECEIGTTRLTSYFNEQYGFVRLEYGNIDGSLLTMRLVEVNKEANRPPATSPEWSGGFRPQ